MLRPHVSHTARALPNPGRSGGTWNPKNPRTLGTPEPWNPRNLRNLGNVWLPRQSESHIRATV
jgi:hypothetical protein